MTEFVDINHADELDRFVEHHPKCHFMQTSAWGRVKSDWGWTGIICRDHSRMICGTMVVLRHTVHHTGSCMLYAPRGPIFYDGDFRTFEELIEAARQLARECKAYLVRIDPMIEAGNTDFLELTQKLGFQCNAASDFSLFQPRMCYVTDLQGHTPESLLAFYNRTKRYDIRTAERRGVTVRMGGLEDMPDFVRMMTETADRCGFSARSAEYYRTFLIELGDIAKLYIAEKEGKTIAATMTAELGNRVWHMYACSDSAYRADFANELLQWEMQRYAVEHGYRWFDFRGVEGYPVKDNPKYGLHHYKQGFGAQFHDYIGQLDLITRPHMEKAIRCLQNIALKKR